MRARLILLVGLACASSASIGTAHADCTSGHAIITTGTSQIFTQAFAEEPSLFYASYGAVTSCGAYNGCAPFSPQVQASFWQLNAGDPAVGVGTDNGAFDLVDSPGALTFAAFPSYGYYSGAQVNTHWGAGTDGCIGADNCAAALFTDQIDGKGYFALTTAKSDANFTTRFDQPGTNPSGSHTTSIILAEFPTPSVETTGGIVVSAPELTGPDPGIYYKDNCIVSFLGYHVYTLATSAGGPAPADLSRDGWQRRTTDPVPLGTETSIPYFCFAGQDGYIAISLVFDNGFETPFLSQPVQAPMLCCPSDTDGDGSCDPDDCAPNDPGIRPGAPESCNGIDDDCDGLVDEDAFGEDADGDGIHAACDNCPAVANPMQLDADLDSRGDACDNCILQPNPGQGNADDDSLGDVCDACTDTDGDGFGDRGFLNVCPVDNCSQVPNASQADTDADGLGDDCDNCVAVANPSQADADADDEGDDCDTDDGRITTSFPDADTLQWDMETGFTLWNAYRGSLSVLRTSPTTYTQQVGSNPDAARMCRLGVTHWMDPYTPPPGTVAYYLTTGISGPGFESGLGRDSDGAIRNNGNPCP